MKRVLVFIFLFGIVFGQSVSDSLFLVNFTKKNEIIRDGIMLGGEMFFAFNQVDTEYISPPYKSSYVLKYDTLSGSITRIKVSPNNARLTEINRLFTLTHPVTQEQVIGFLGVGIRVNPNDTSYFAFTGYVKPDFSELRVYDTFFVEPASGPYYTFTRQNDVFVINDTTFLFFHGSSLVRMVYDNNGFYIADSITNALGSQYFFKFSNSPVLTIQQVVLPQYQSGTLNFREVQWQSSKMSLGAPQSITAFADMYASYGKLAMLNYNDTLFMVIPESKNNFYKNVFSKFIYNPISGLILYDSTFSDTLHFPISMILKPAVALHFPNAYVFSDNNGADFYNPFLWDYEYIHYSTNQVPYVTLDCIDVRSLSSEWRYVIGGNDLYQINGLLSPSENVAYLYGWSFPLGDTLRHDGDAFIWKITWDGLVTPILGKAPKYAFKIFPNPAKNILKISGKTKETTTFLLRSTDGKEVLTQKFPAGQEDWELDVSQVPRGIYLLEILTEGGARFTEKVVPEWVVGIPNECEESLRFVSSAWEGACVFLPKPLFSSTPSRN